MFKNYFVTATRNFFRNKGFSAINVLGLSIGISAALVIFLIVYYEFSFDKFEKDRDRIYHVLIGGKGENGITYNAAVPAPLGATAEKEVTGLEITVPVFQFQGDANAKVSVKRHSSAEAVVYRKQANIIFTNGNYFELLPYRWLAGSLLTALKDPFSVVLTESRAQQYFPNVPPQEIVGQQIAYNDSLRSTVTGIVKDLEEQTIFSAAEFISLPTVMHTGLKGDFMMDVWNDAMAYSQLFVKLSKGTSAKHAEDNLRRLVEKYNKSATGNVAVSLQPLADVHFNYGLFGQRTAHKPTLYGLLAIAVFLLLLGCINFINLTTAQGSERAKEIGIRKTMGSSRKDLVFQFLGETFFTTIVATTLSVIITPLLLNIFSDFIPPGLRFELFSQPHLLAFLFLLMIIVSFSAGFYPAMVLSGFRPVSVLKNQMIMPDQTRRAWIRKTLIVSQFVIAQFFVIGTLLVSKQISYSLNKDLGFKKEAIVTFTIPRDTSLNNRQVLLQKIGSIAGIEKVSLGFLPPATDGAAYTNIRYTNKPADEQPKVQIRWGDTNYLSLYHIPLLAGRNVQQSDTVREFVINETYAATLGFKRPADALNIQLEFNGKKMPVVGVMQDFHENSLHAPIEPVVFACFNKRSGFYHVALKPQNEQGTGWQRSLIQIEDAFRDVYPESEFNYSFFDDAIATFYKSEQDTARLLKWATGLAILVSCLGLLGLVIYTTNIRRKEIGIRKVLGASVAQIVTSLSKEFVQLVIVAFLVAAPIAWWAAFKWLQDFTYRIEMSWWLFALSGLGMIVLALTTLSIHTIKAAIANPVKSLRSE